MKLHEQLKEWDRSLEKHWRKAMWILIIELVAMTAICVYLIWLA